MAQTYDSSIASIKALNSKNGTQTNVTQFPGYSNLSMGPGGSGVGGGSGINYSTISTLTPQQQQLMNLMQGNIQQGGGQNALYGQQGAQMSSALQNALQANPASSLSAQNTAKYMQDAVATPLLRQYDQSIMPRLKDAYAAVGALMSSRRGLAQQNALDQLQTTIGSELGKAQLSNQQLSANLSEQMAQRQANTVNQQQQNSLGYNQLAAQLTGQSQMAIQPYTNSLFGQGSGGYQPQSFNNFYQPQYGQALSQPQQNRSQPQSISPIALNALQNNVAQGLKTQNDPNYQVYRGNVINYA